MRVLFCLLLSIAASLRPAPVRAQGFEIEQLILDIQKLSTLKDILNDLYKSYQVLSDGYEAIKNISQGNFDLHKVFLDGLLAVNPVVKNYQRAAAIVDYEARVVAEYKAAYGKFSSDKNFTAAELSYLANVYNNLISESAKNLEDLINVVTADKLRMSDDERLRAIDRIYESSKEQYIFLKQFDNGTQILAVQRATEINDTQTLRSIYNIN